MTNSSPRSGAAALAAWRLRVGHLNPRAPHEVAIHPDADQREALAQELDLLALPALSLVGSLRASGRADWRLDARLSARVVQPCVVSLAPVETTLTEDIYRVWTPDPAQPDDIESEMGDDAVEPLGQFIDLGAVLHEALVLALPLYPRAPDATQEGVSDGDPATESDEAEDRRRPFSGLSDLLAARKQGR